MGHKVALGAAFVAVVGSLGLWVGISPVFAEFASPAMQRSLEIYGYEGGDGRIIAILGLLSMAALWFPKSPNVRTVVPAILMGVFSLVAFVDLAGIQAKLVNENGIRQVGWGLTIAAASSLVAVAASIWGHPRLSGKSPAG